MMDERVSDLARLFAVEPENDWRTDAACQDHDPELFFAGDDAQNRERDDREAAAKAVCGTCAVSSACLDYAVRAGERYGIWGGLNASERRTLHDRRGRSDRQRVSSPA